MDSPGSDPMDETAILLHFHCSQEAGLQHEGTIRPLAAYLHIIFTIAVTIAIVIAFTVFHLILAASLHLLFNLLVHNYTWGNIEPIGQFETFDYLHL